MSRSAWGWMLGLALLSHLGLAAEQKRIAVSIDDVPFASATDAPLGEARRVTGKLLSALKQAQVKAIGFVNEDQLYRYGSVDAGIRLLDDWLVAGMELGNHTFGHKSFWETPLASYEDAVIKGEVITRQLMEKHKLSLHYYRYPYSQTGKNDEEKAQFEQFLAQRGYTVAPLTIEHDDYYYACVYDKLAQAGKKAEQRRVVAECLQHLDVALDSYETMSQELFGRQIAQVLLVHASRLNADSLPQTLARLKQRGYGFVALDEALQDPAYQSPDKASKQYGPTWLTRWAQARKQKMTVMGHPDPEGWIAEQHKQYCEH